jgi:hypothetical protein
MNNIVKFGIAASAVALLSGCVNSGPQASFKQRFKDNFLLTSASDVPAGQVRCVALVKPFTFQSGSVTYTLPAGQYKGKQKNRSGYFYNTPAHVQVSSYFAGSVYGIYINNQFTQGNLFGVNPDGYDDRPIRGTVLPSSIFSYLRKSGNC